MTRKQVAERRKTMRKAGVLILSGVLFISLAAAKRSSPEGESAVIQPVSDVDTGDLLPAINLPDSGQPELLGSIVTLFLARHVMYRFV